MATYATLAISISVCKNAVRRDQAKPKPAKTVGFLSFMGKVQRREITDQQLAFAQRYTVHFNAGKAAKEAGYSEKSADRIGHELIKNSLVKHEIDRILELVARDHKELKHRIVEQLHNLAFSDIKNYVRGQDGDDFSLVPVTELPSEITSAIQEVKVTRSTRQGETTTTVNFKLCSKEKSLELLCRHLGMLKDVTTVEIKRWSEDLKTIPIDTIKQLARGAE